MGTLPVALSVMTAGEIRYETAESICRVVATETVSQAFFVQHGPYLDQGRNKMVRVFNDERIRERCTHLLMVDSDIAFTPEDVIKLYEADKPIVSGVYYSLFDGFPKPVIYEHTVVMDHKRMDAIGKWPDGWPTWAQRMVGAKVDTSELEPVVQVAAAGAGFLMIHSDVLDAMGKEFGEPQPWFSEPVIDGIYFGEDLAFCLRAQDLGFDVWAHRDVEVGHTKSTPIGPTPAGNIAL